MASGPQQFGRTAADSWWILLGETEDLSAATGATIKVHCLFDFYFKFNETNSRCSTPSDSSTWPCLELKK